VPFGSAWKPKHLFYEKRYTIEIAERQALSSGASSLSLQKKVEKSRRQIHYSHALFRLRGDFMAPKADANFSSSPDIFLAIILSSARPVLVWME
jgi:hypothetical protein